VQVGGRRYDSVKMGEGRGSRQEKVLSPEAGRMRGEARQGGGGHAGRGGKVDNTVMAVILL
jgi:hypothetical protein